MAHAPSYYAVMLERERQVNEKGYTSALDSTRNAAYWALAVAHELGQLADNAVKLSTARQHYVNDESDFQRALVKIAAVCIAAMESYDIANDVAPRDGE